MGTAQEVEMLINQHLENIKPSMAYQRAKMADLMAYGSHFAMAREVCARRARKLRKRGEEVRFYRNTCNGKARYTWSKRIPPWEVVLTPNN